MGGQTRITLHPLLEKRHRIYSTWWGKLIRADDWRNPVITSLILNSALLTLAFLRWDATHVILSVLIGFVLGTLLEYVTHRGTFHQLWKIPVLKGLEDIHMPHHLEKNDGINAGPFFYLPLYLMTFVLIFLISGSVGLTCALFSGIAFWFCAYEFSHDSHHAHESRPGMPVRRGRYLNFMCRFHTIHHDDDSTVNFGISQPVWDFVFRTYQPPRSL